MWQLVSEGSGAFLLVQTTTTKLITHMHTHRTQMDSHCTCAEQVCALYAHTLLSLALPLRSLTNVKSQLHFVSC